MSIDSIIGKTMAAVIQRGADCIEFEATTGERWSMFHSQDCCESVSIEDIVGDLGDLVGSPIVMAEEATSNADPKADEYDDSHTWTFYKLATAKGYVTIRWYGSSNGYYSEGVDFTQTWPVAP